MSYFIFFLGLPTRKWHCKTVGKKWSKTWKHTLKLRIFSLYLKRVTPPDGDAFGRFFEAVVHWIFSNWCFFERNRSFGAFSIEKWRFRRHFHFYGGTILDQMSGNTELLYIPLWKVSFKILEFVYGALYFCLFWVSKYWVPNCCEIVFVDCMFDFSVLTRCFFSFFSGGGVNLLLI